MMIAAFSGEIDFTTREAFREQLAELRDAPFAIVDLSDVSYMDSSALAELLLLHRLRTRAGLGEPRVVVGPRISRLFDVAGLRSVVPSYGTLEEAKRGE
jgi:anti-anti-sigma factor